MRLNSRMLLPYATFLLVVGSVRTDFFGEKKETAYDLLEAAMTTSENKYQYFGDGLDGFPVFGFKPGSEVKQPYRLYLPEKLPSEFDIVVTFKPTSVRTSYLFAVLNPFETVVQLGVRISDGPASNQNVSLVYTNSDAHTHSEEVAKFTVPKLLKKWSKIVLRVSASEVILYLNCHEMARQKVTRIPQELVFDTASTLYIAQAGPHIQEKYDGVLQTLKLYTGHPQDLIKCATDFEFLEIEGSGDESSIPESGSGYVDDDQFGQEGNYELEKEDEVVPPPLISPPPPNSIARGPKGDKGDKGDSVRGPPGPPGPPGAAVYDRIENGNTDERVKIGQKGEPGSCSCNATDLLTSFTMPKMIQGPKGEPGLPGKEGKQGQMGLTGAAGPPGERGRPGAVGAKGDSGDPGPPGPEGPQGKKGAPGRDGIPGEKGAQGPPGPPGKGEFSVHDPSWTPRDISRDGIAMRRGLPGHKGEPGVSGNVGAKGEPGHPGDKGEKGDDGKKGMRGVAGKEGPRGDQGFKGEPGAPGAPGIAGAPGENGRPAEKGAKGDIGPEGKPGPPGPPGTGIATVITENGSSRQSISSVKGERGELGPRGYKGDLGQKGEKGDKGEYGAPGIPGVNGVQGPLGDKGDPGRDGTPGFHGVKGLKGDKGERGPPGETVFAAAGDYIAIKGEPGKDGKRGKRGRPGLTGPPGIGQPGSPGIPGSPGPSGPKGDKGDPAEVSTLGMVRGLKGEKGFEGLPGIPGPPGLPGQRGPPGPPGPPGVPSQGNYLPVPGPPGPPGNPGPPGISLMGQNVEPGIGRSRIFEERDHYPSRQENNVENFKTLQGARFSELKILQELKQLRELIDQLRSGGAPVVSGSKHTTESFTRIVPGAVTFQNTEAMTKMTSVSSVGTLAYLIDEQALVVRVNNGWQYIALGSLLAITTPVPPTTLPPPANPPFEASNLINQIPMKADGTGLRMAALNEPSTGDTHGVRGADYACYRQSKRAGLRGTFRAFLSSRVQNVDSIVRLGDRELPIVNIKGDVLFNSWKDMFDGNGAYFSQNPRIYSFNGKNILTDFGWPEKVVWHGSHKLGDRAMDTYCDAWHSGGSDRYGLASPLTGGRLLEQIRYSCDNKFALLCIEVTSELSRRRRSLADGSDLDEDDDLTEEEYVKYLDKLMAH